MVDASAPATFRAPMSSDLTTVVVRIAGNPILHHLLIMLLRLILIRLGELSLLQLKVLRLVLD